MNVCSGRFHCSQRGQRQRGRQDDKDDPADQTDAVSHDRQSCEQMHQNADHRVHKPDQRRERDDSGIILGFVRRHYRYLATTAAATRQNFSGRSFSIRRNNEPVSFAVFEHRVSPPGLFLWRTFELHSAVFQLLVCLLDVITGVGHVHERADSFFISLRGKQHHTRIRFRNSQFDPALLLIKRLIGNDREPEFIGIKVQGSVLVRHGNADEFDLFNHDAAKLSGLTSSRPQLTMIGRKKLLSFYRYSDSRIHFILLNSYLILSVCLVSRKPFLLTIMFWMC
jgi:hypothetical protein